MRAAACEPPCTRLFATIHLSLLALGATVSLGVSGWARRSIDSDVLYFADAEDEGEQQGLLKESTAEILILYRR